MTPERNNVRQNAVYLPTNCFIMGSRYKTPALVQTIEKHNRIYRDYLELNQMLKLTMPENWRDVTQTWKYQQLADKYYMHPKSIGRIVIGKLTENADERLHQGKRRA